MDVVPDALSFTCTVNVNVPEPLGVPKMAPPAAFSVKPAGRAPALMLHVYGDFPPAAFNVTV